VRCYHRLSARFLAVLGVATVLADTTVVGEQTRPSAPSVESERPPEIQVRLRCISTSRLRIDITNIGAEDTSLVLGSALNRWGRFVVPLFLEVTRRGQTGAYGYSWSRYVRAVDGSLDRPWLQFLPAQSTFSLLAKPTDFVGIDAPLASFPTGVRLAVRLVLRSPPKDQIPGTYWSGTLTSNPCSFRAQ
jgi:hypothetical protein